VPLGPIRRSQGVPVVSDFDGSDPPMVVDGVTGYPYQITDGDVVVGPDKAAFQDSWNDLIVSAVGVNPTGGASAPAVNATTGLLEFSGTADNIICGCWQMTHGWAAALTAGAVGYIVRPHMHVRWPTSTATNARWKLEVDRVTPNGTHENTYGNYTTLTTITVANPQDVNKSALVSFGDLDMTGYTTGSTLIHFRITRLASSDAADTYTGIIALYSIDLHYQGRGFGSPSEIPA
jgi:hypothetical protein